MYLSLHEREVRERENFIGGLTYTHNCKFLHSIGMYIPIPPYIQWVGMHECTYVCMYSTPIPNSVVVCMYT